MRPAEEVLNLLNVRNGGPVDFFEVYSDSKKSAAISGEVIYARIRDTKTGRRLLVCRRKTGEDPRTTDARPYSIPYKEGDNEFALGLLRRIEEAESPQR